MKVLLTTDVKGLGLAGEVKDVKPGYGQNFLIKKNMAKNATPEVLENYQNELKLKNEKHSKDIDEANKLKEMIEAGKWTIKHKVGANGHLIGTITNKEIAAVMQAQGIQLDKKQIHIDQKIKTVGIFEADCKLGFGVHATISLDIIEEIK